MDEVASVTVPMNATSARETAKAAMIPVVANVSIWTSIASIAQPPMLAQNVFFSLGLISAYHEVG
jgi:hypothetical protein